VNLISPNTESELLRQKIIGCVERIIAATVMGCGIPESKCVVFTFGSVPLKTYLPNSDIDIGSCIPSSMVKTFFSTLSSQLQQSKNEAIPIDSINFINARGVNGLIKCVANGVQVDVSVNTSNAYETLCFLEEMDQLVGQDHLFKRSILLVKAWCMYESRIMGSFSALLSSYAVEVIVFHVLNVYHSSATSPLTVLLQFLRLVAGFDFSQQLLTIFGSTSLDENCLPRRSGIIQYTPPASKSPYTLVPPALPRFSPDELNVCVSEYCKAQTADQRHPFSPKHLNIADPLDNSNNLGRGISFSNFLRIRNATAKGFEYLQELILRAQLVLQLPPTQDNTIPVCTDTPAEAASVLSPDVLESTTDLDVRAERDLLLKSFNGFFRNAWRRYGDRPEQGDGKVPDLHTNIQETRSHTRMRVHVARDYSSEQDALTSSSDVPSTRSSTRAGERRGVWTRSPSPAEPVSPEQQKPSFSQMVQMPVVSQDTTSRTRNSYQSQVSNDKKIQNSFSQTALESNARNTHPGSSRARGAGSGQSWRKGSRRPRDSDRSNDAGGHGKSGRPRGKADSKSSGQTSRGQTKRQGSVSGVPGRNREGGASGREAKDGGKRRGNHRKTGHANSRWGEGSRSSTKDRNKRTGGSAHSKSEECWTWIVEKGSSQRKASRT
jgi:hypothetical protein